METTARPTIFSAKSEARIEEFIEAARGYGYDVETFSAPRGLVIVFRQERPGRRRDTHVRVELFNSPSTGRDRWSADAVSWSFNGKVPVSRLVIWLRQNRAV